MTLALVLAVAAPYTNCSTINVTYRVPAMSKHVTHFISTLSRIIDEISCANKGTHIFSVQRATLRSAHVGPLGSCALAGVFGDLSSSDIAHCIGDRNRNDSFHARSFFVTMLRGSHSCWAARYIATMLECPVPKYAASLRTDNIFNSYNYCNPKDLLELDS